MRWLVAIGAALLACCLLWLVLHDHRGFVSPADIARDPQVDLLWEIVAQ